MQSWCDELFYKFIKRDFYVFTIASKYTMRNYISRPFTDCELKFRRDLVLLSISILGHFMVKTSLVRISFQKQTRSWLSDWIVILSGRRIKALPNWNIGGQTKKVTIDYFIRLRNMGENIPKICKSYVLACCQKNRSFNSVLAVGVIVNLQRGTR